MNGVQNSSSSNSLQGKNLTAVKEKSEGGMKKSADISEKTRKEGNKLFSQKNHSKDLHKAILWYYCKSIAYAPAKSEQLAGAYSNRSVLLMHLGRYQEAIVDMDRTLQTTKSEVLLQKVLARRAKLIKSNQDLVKFLNNLDINENEEKSSSKQKDNVALGLPIITMPSSIVPCASDSVLLDCNETFGRHYLAARDIQAGEIIIVEEGYICVPKNNLRYYVCSHCLQFAWNGIPCSGCPFAVYCSEDCKKNAWEEYHDLECQIYPHLMFLKSELNGCVMADIAIALRIFLKAVKKEGLNAVLNEAEVINKDNELTGLFSEGVLKTDKFKSLYKLSGSVQYNVTAHKEVALTTVKLINLFLDKTNILNSKRDSQGRISSLVITQLKIIFNKIRHIVAINALTYEGIICECSHLDTTECVCGANRGILIAPCSSLMNHSCCANVGRHFLPKKKVVFFTLTPVKKGEQLCISYGQSITTERSIRQKKLLQCFHFTCKCTACTENWPLASKIQLLFNSKDVTAIMCEIIYEFKKFYPKESELFLHQLPEKIWSSSKEGLEKAKLTCELIFKYNDDYMKAFLMSRPYRDFIDQVIFDLYGEKCDIPEVCA